MRKPFSHQKKKIIINNNQKLVDKDCSDASPFLDDSDGIKGMTFMHCTQDFWFSI